MELEADKRERNQKHDIPTGQVVNVLHSGVKRVWIEMGFFIMLLAAVCTITEIDTVLHSSFVGMLCKATINTGYGHHLLCHAQGYAPAPPSAHGHVDCAAGT